MEVSTKQLLPMPPHQQDPNSPSSSTSSSSSSSTSPSHPGHHRALQQQPGHSHSHTLPPSPRPVPRTIDTTPFPTTFVQADTTSFKQVVQMLTGAEPQPAKNDATTTTAGAGAGAAAAAAANGGQACRPKKPSFKLYERRSSMKNLKMIAPLAMGPPPSPSPPRTTAPEILSPSVLDFPSLRLTSPVTPLTGDPFSRSSPASSEDAERAAIAERGFFLHPSPRGTGAGAAEPPRLLPLFPVTSPRMAAPSE